MRAAFTLVELMIVVAIIGILAAIAIPNFAAMQYRAKRAELPTNVRAIKLAEGAYEAHFDQYLPVGVHPTSLPGKQQVAWGGGNAEFQQLGWSPDGNVRGQYSVTTVAYDVTVTGQADMDGDGVRAVYTATRSLDVHFNNNNDTY